MKIPGDFRNVASGYLLLFTGQKLSFLVKDNCRLFLQFNPYAVAMFTILLIVGLPAYQTAPMPNEETFHRLNFKSSRVKPVFKHLLQFHDLN